MTKLSDQEEIAAIKTAARELAENALRAITTSNPDIATPADALAESLDRIVKAWRAQAVALEGVTKRGAVGRQKELRTAAGLLAAVMVDVAKLGTIDQSVPNPMAPVVFDARLGGVQRPGFELPGPDIPGSFGPSGVLDLSQAGPMLPDNQYVDAFKDALIVHPDGGGAALVTAEQAQIAADIALVMPEASPESIAAAVRGEEHPDLVPLAEVVAMDTQNHWAAWLDQASADADKVRADALAYIGDGIPSAPQVMPEQREASTYVTTTLAEPAMQPVNMPMFIDPVAKPPAPARLTYRDVKPLWEALPQSDHKSYSQITNGEDCGFKALFSQAAHHKLVAGGQPQWANVGGTAFHTAAELLERHGPGILAVDHEALWSDSLSTAIAEVEQETGTQRDGWRASNKGLEGYDWWRVQGADMVKAYAAYHGQPERRDRTAVLAFQDGSLALELPFQLDVEGVRLDGIIDKIEIDKATGGLAVVDWKAGRFDPDVFQLSIYAHHVHRAWGIPLERIEVGHWFARKGKYETYPDWATVHPWDEIVYRTHAQVTREQAQLATPRVSSFCHGCEFKLICPAGPR